MIEIRNDLISDERGQDEWAERLSAALVHAAAH
jgi:predicted N-formylglutamate amidohydrolase